MKRLAIPLACILAIALSSCSLPQLAAFFTPAALSADQFAKVQRGCQLAAPALEVAVTPGLPEKVRETAIYPKAYCDQLLAGTVPATTDANTPAWFDKTLAALKIVARAAGIILPLLL
jgi:hypothetical protein